MMCANYKHIMLSKIMTISLMKKDLAFILETLLYSLNAELFQNYTTICAHFVFACKIIYFLNLGILQYIQCSFYFVIITE